MERKRKVIFRGDDGSCRNLARKMLDKGYEVLVRYSDTEDPQPFPF